MVALWVVLTVFLVLVCVLLAGAYFEIGRELPCKSISQKHKDRMKTTSKRESQDNSSSRPGQAA